jgi:hypothetical protein
MLSLILFVFTLTTSHTHKTNVTKKTMYYFFNFLKHINFEDNYATPHHHAVEAVAVATAAGEPVAEAAGEPVAEAADEPVDVADFFQVVSLFPAYSSVSCDTSDNHPSNKSPKPFLHNTALSNHSQVFHLLARAGMHNSLVRHSGMCLHFDCGYRTCTCSCTSRS